MPRETTFLTDSRSEEPLAKRIPAYQNHRIDLLEEESKGR